MGLEACSSLSLKVRVLGANPAESAAPQGDGDFADKFTAFHPNCWAGSPLPPAPLVSSSIIFILSFPVSTMTSPVMISLPLRFSCPFTFPSLCSQLRGRTAPFLQAELWFTCCMESKTIWEMRKGHLSQSLLRCEHLALRLQLSQAFLHMLLSSLSTRTGMDSLSQTKWSS